EVFEQLLRDQVNTLVRIKLLYLQAKKKIPDDKLPELQKKIEKNFEDNMLKSYMANTHCKTRRELEDRLRSMGNSVERLKRVTVEETIARQWFSDQVKADELKVTHEEMLTRYRERLARYEHSATARYEELFVRLSKYPSEADA